MKHIKQKYYGKIEFDVREKDVIQIWHPDLLDPQVIQVERENLKKFIEILTEELNKTK